MKQDSNGRWRLSNGKFASKRKVRWYLMFKNKETGKLKWWVWLIIGLAILAVLLGSCARAGYWAYKKYFKAVSFVPPITAAAAAPTDAVAVATAPTDTPNTGTTTQEEQQAAPPPIVAGKCPTTLWAQQAIEIDVDKIDTEPCSWKWRGKVVTAKCPEGMICTFDDAERVKRVHLGDNSTYQVYAGTWRYISAFPPSDAVHDPCLLLSKEQAFGRREVPTFDVFAGDNLDCPQAISMVIAEEGGATLSLDNVVKESESATIIDETNKPDLKCPLFANRELVPLDDNGCLFEWHQEVSTDHVPNGWWSWMGSEDTKKYSGDLLTTGEATFYRNGT